MATGGEVEGQMSVSVSVSEDLSELKCQPCHEDGRIREAVGMCTDCQDYLCRKCFDSHTIPKPMRKHTLLDNQHMLKSNIKLDRKDKCTKKCSRHDDKTFKYYCVEHEELSCSVCLNMDHRTCQPVQYIPHAAKNLDSNAEFKQADMCLNKTLTLCKTVSDTEVITLESIETSCVAALESLELHRKKVNDALDKIQADIVKKAETMKARALEKISNITDTYRVAQREIQEFQTTIMQLQRRHQNCGLYTEMMQMKDRLTALEGDMKEAMRKLSLQATQIKFTPNLDLLETLKHTDTFGKLTGAESGFIKKAEHLINIDAKPTTNENNCYIRGSTFLPDGKLVIADDNSHHIKTVDIGQNRVITQTKLSSSPADVCTINNNQVAATLPWERKIVLVNVGCNMSIDRTVSVNGTCHGVDYKDNKLAVSFTRPDKVQIISLQGAVLQDIKTDPQGQSLFNNPYYLTFDQTGETVYVTNCYSHKVVRVNLDGSPVAMYTDSKLQRPTGTVLDSDGNVYVCGRGSHNIHQISPDCRKLRILLGRDDGIVCPWSISYRQTDDTFWVGMYSNNKVMVYQAIRDSR